MKLAYQVSTPEVEPLPSVTAYQGDLAASFRRLKEVGYDGAELMVADPSKFDAKWVLRLAKEYGLDIPMVCTGEVFGQGKVFFSSPDDSVRNEAIRRVKAAVDAAEVVGGQINVGRSRGALLHGIPPELCRKRSLDGLAEVCDYAAPKNVLVALEPVNSLAMNFINTTQEGVAVARELGRPNLKLMIDSNHMFIDDKDPLRSIVDAREFASYVHLTDSNRKYPGNCKIDFKAFINALRGIGYDGYMSVEVFQWPDQDTALVESFRHIKPLM